MKGLVEARFRSFFAGLGIACLLAGCGIEGEQSKQSHVIGQTSVARGALSSCQEKASKAHPTVNSYIKKIVDYVIEKNPNTFKGALAPTVFCEQFVTDDPFLGNSSPNASAIIGTGLLTFNGPVILTSPNDAAFAAVVAHELAHVTMDHSRREPDVVKNSAEYQKLISDRSKLESEHRSLLDFKLPDFQSLYYKTKEALNDPSLSALRNQVNKDLDFYIDEIESDLAFPFDYEAYLSGFVTLAEDFSTSTVLVPVLKEIKTVMEPIEKLNDKINALRDQATDLADRLIGGGPGSSANWREQEADEVGYELYLRAGFASSQYVSIHKNILRQSRSDQACEELLAKKQIPERGRMSHPQSCWRIYDINVLENEAHKQDYAPLLSGAKTENLFPGELEKVKSYIQGLK